MQREPVVSISIAAVGIDPVTRMLEVEYKNGQIRQYPDVPATPEEDLMTPGVFTMHLRQRKRPAFPIREAPRER